MRNIMIACLVFASVFSVPVFGQYAQDTTNIRVDGKRVWIAGQNVAHDYSYMIGDTVLNVITTGENTIVVFYSWVEMNQNQPNRFIYKYLIDNYSAGEHLVQWEVLNRALTGFSGFDRQIHITSDNSQYLITVEGTENSGLPILTAGRVEISKKVGLWSRVSGALRSLVPARDVWGVIKSNRIAGYLPETWAKNP